MNLNEYQDKAWSTALPQCQNPNYMLLGLLNEGGEVAGAVKKYERGDYGYEVLREKIKKELGDQFWYLAGFAKTLDLTLEELAEANVAKLADRKARGVLAGSGDDR